VTLHASPRLETHGIWEGPCPWIGPYYLSPESERKFRRVISTCHRLGMKVLPYFAPGMHADTDLDRFMAEVARLKTTYGFDGVYYDGLYPADDWTKSYELMRMTREWIGPDDPVYIHNTESPPLGDQRNGRIYCPFMDTYADFQLRGESVEISGLDDPYLRFCASGYGNSNVIGLLKLNTARDIGDEMLYHLAFLKMHGRMLLSGYPEVGSAVYPGEKGEIRDDWWRYVRALQALKESGVGHPPPQ